MYPPPALRTSQPELLGSTAGIILTVIVAVLGLAVLIGAVYWADSHPPPGVKRPGTGPGGGDRSGGAQGSPGQGHRPWGDVSHRHVPERGHAHGKPRSWVLVAVVLTAFIVGGLAIILHVWPLMWACAGIILLAIPAGKAVGIMDDTVSWASTPAASEDEPPGAAPERTRSERSGTRTG